MKLLLGWALFWAGLIGLGFTVRAMKWADTKLTTKVACESPSQRGQLFLELRLAQHPRFEQSLQPVRHLLDADDIAVQVNREFVQPRERIDIGGPTYITESPEQFNPYFDVAFSDSHPLQYDQVRRRRKELAVLVPESTSNILQRSDGRLGRLSRTFQHQPTLGQLPMPSVPYPPSVSPRQWGRSFRLARGSKLLLLKDHNPARVRCQGLTVLVPESSANQKVGAVS